MIPDQKDQTLWEKLELMRVFKLVPKKIRDQGEEAIILFLRGAISRYMTYFYAILYGNAPIAERLISYSPFAVWVFLPFLWRERAMRFKDLLQMFERAEEKLQ